MTSSRHQKYAGYKGKVSKISIRTKPELGSKGKFVIGIKVGTCYIGWVICSFVMIGKATLSIVKGPLKNNTIDEQQIEIVPTTLFTDKRIQTHVTDQKEMKQ